MSGDEDYLRLRWTAPMRKGAGDIEAGLVTELDVEKDHVWLQLTTRAPGLRPCRRDANHADALTFQQGAGGIEEVEAVIDDDAAHGHSSSLHDHPVSGIAATRKIGAP